MRSLRYDTLWGWTAVLLAGLAWCVLPLRASAQGLDVRATAAPVNTLSFTDVDFLNATTPRWLFTIDIDAHGRTIIAVMTVTLKAELALGQTYDPAVELKTRQFRVQATRTITNLDIGRGKTIVDTSYIVDPGAKAAFKEKALPGGTMPAGIYTFNVRVDEVGGEGATGTAPQPPTIVLSNPSSVELLFPFDGDRSVNQFPLFQWLFDGPRSTIAIFEKLPNQESLEEAAS